MANEEHLALLRQGVDIWNRWRQKNPMIEPDLSKADLHGANLVHTDLSKADLSRAILRKADLSLANLSKASLSATNLSAASLSFANLIRADLSFANLSFANLNGANLSDTDLSRAILSNSNLSDADLSRADLSNTSLMGVQALSTNFTSANLTGACLQDWNINRETKLENVRCDYMYLKSWEDSWDSSEEGIVFDDRCPSVGDFASGEFAILFQKTAAEIQKLLDQLSQTYPTNTTTGKMQLAAEAIAQIENNPTLMQRLLSAIQAGGTAALEQYLNHPAASFVMGVIEDWKQTKEN